MRDNLQVEDGRDENDGRETPWNYLNVPWTNNEKF